MSADVAWMIGSADVGEDEVGGEERMERRYVDMICRFGILLLLSA